MYLSDLVMDQYFHYYVCNNEQKNGLGTIPLTTPHTPYFYIKGKYEGG
jgi:hypothetical protein